MGISNQLKGISPRLAALAALSTLALAVTIALLYPPKSAADGCDYSVLCDGAPVPLQYRWIGTAVPVRRPSVDGGKAYAIYRSLIPHPFSMPQRPMIGLYLLKNDVPTSLGGLSGPHGTENNWVEGGIDLLVFYRGEDYWWHYQVPVNSVQQYDGARPAGWPKFLADIPEPSQDGNGWQFNAWVHNLSHPLREHLDWQPAKVTPKPLIQDYGGQYMPYLILKEADKGPLAYRYVQTAKSITPLFNRDGTLSLGSLSYELGLDQYNNFLRVKSEYTTLPPPQFGMLHFYVNPNLDQNDKNDPTPLPHLFDERHAKLSDLINTSQTVPGVMFAGWSSVYLSNEMVANDAGWSPGQAKWQRRPRKKHHQATHHKPTQRHRSGLSRSP